MSDVPKEMLTSHWLLSDYPENLTQNYFTFALVRHPMERAISFFKWHKKYKDISFETFCLGLFSKNKWESTLRTGGLSYKTLRTSIIPEIIAYYLKIKTDLSPCFDNERLCNQFIHMNVNNYDYLIKDITRGLKRKRELQHPKNNYNYVIKVEEIK